MVQPWKKTLIGKKKSCLQTNPSFTTVKGEEDCLYLNIFRVRKGKTARMSVMVFIHGGGYRTGSGSDYNGEMLTALYDVLVVTINYRLGIFGFFSLPDSELLGNYGLQDQILALKWVKAHISAFGGDPSKVTVFGESAGASSVSLLLLSPLTKGLFTRAIAESASALSPWAVYERQNRSIAAGFAASFGCRETHIATCLRGTPATRLLLKPMPSTFYPLTAPTVDGKVITALPWHQGKKGKLPVPDLELLIGFNKDEGTIFLPKIEWNQAAYKQYITGTLKWRYKKSANIIGEIASFEYRKFLNPENWSLMMSCSDFLADFYFKEGIIKMAGDWSKAGKRVYVYDFTYLPEHLRVPSLGIAHSIELGFVFGRPFFSSGDWLVAKYTESDANFSRKMMKMWTDFVKYGVPESKWPIFDLDKKSYLEINVTNTRKHNYNPRRMTLWHSVLPKVLALTNATKRESKISPNAPAIPKITAKILNNYNLLELPIIP
ncbi:cholinesterase 2-like isoform X2 [Rhopilema esculentum]